jgi:hypothetical protein
MIEQLKGEKDTAQRAEDATNLALESQIIYNRDSESESTAVQLDSDLATYQQTHNLESPPPPISDQTQKLLEAARSALSQNEKENQQNKSFSNTP